IVNVVVSMTFDSYTPKPENCSHIVSTNSIFVFLSNFERSTARFIGHFPTRGPERLVGICTPYRYKFPVGARDLFSSLEAVSSIPNNLSTFPLVTCNFPNLQKRLIELFPP